MKINKSGSIVTNGAIALFAGVLGSVLTLAVGNRFASTSDSSDAQPQQIAATTISTQPSDVNPQVVELRRALADASAERSQLAESVATLVRQMDQFDSELAGLSDRVADQVTSHELNEIIPGIDLSSLDGVPENNRGRQRGTAKFGREPNAQQRVEYLVAAGVDEQTARDLQVRRDQYQLARLELFDQAAREGWAESEQFNNQLEALDAGRLSLRDELGDDAYDRYLFESGTPNRLMVASIISGSEAEAAGLEVGDLILSYANERLFRVRELQTASRFGSRGEYVQLSLDRGGQLLSADIPRGPLGVTLSTSSIEP